MENNQTINRNDNEYVDCCWINNDNDNRMMNKFKLKQDIKIAHTQHSGKQLINWMNGFCVSSFNSCTRVVFSHSIHHSQKGVIVCDAM